MPLIFEKEISSAKKLAVWEITEPLDFFLSQLGWKFDPDATVKRQLEQACSSVLLNHICGKDLHSILEKDANGKPFLKDNSISVSFSHSKHMVACMTDRNGDPVGIDIEAKRESIIKTAQKFVNPEDSSPETGIMHLHLVWGGKEVLYKLYSKKELDFRTHLAVSYLSDKYVGTIAKNDYVAEYLLGFTLLGDFILVFNKDF